MGKGTIPAVVIDFEIPNYCCKQDNWAFHEKFTLFGNPRLVKVEHDGIGSFIGVRYVRHEIGIKRIASVAPAWVVKVDDVKLRLYLILIGI